MGLRYVLRKFRCSNAYNFFTKDILFCGKELKSINEMRYHEREVRNKGNEGNEVELENVSRYTTICRIFLPLISCFQSNVSKPIRLREQIDVNRFITFSITYNIKF